jgi:hypothetical protein
MQFHLGAVPDSPDFSPDDSWKPLREPGPIRMQILAFPLGVATCAAVAALWFYLTPVTSAPFAPPTLLLGAILVSIPVHELIHASVHPQFGRSHSSVLGLWPSRLLFYAHYSGELSRNRFIAILVMPLVLISVVPLLVSALIGHAPVVLAFVSVFNALCACGDAFGICLLLFQVPSAATVRNQGWRTYWTIHETKIG